MENIVDQPWFDAHSLSNAFFITCNHWLRVLVDVIITTVITTMTIVVMIWSIRRTSGVINNKIRFK